MKWPRRRDDDQPWEASGSLALAVGGEEVVMGGEKVVEGGEETNNRPVLFQSYRHPLPPGATAAWSCPTATTRWTRVARSTS